MNSKVRHPSRLKRLHYKHFKEYEQLISTKKTLPQASITLKTAVNLVVIMVKTE